MHYGNIKTNDIADGVGVRVSLFVSGCRNHCKGCFQPETWDFCYGKEFTKETEDYIINELKKPHISGLTILGGDPMEPENQEALLPFMKRIKKELPEKTIWLYTGYVYEEFKKLQSKVRVGFVTDELIKYIDVLVDGPFVEMKKNLSLAYRGSSNQRILPLTANGLREYQQI